jgi:glycerophosphoryl diester phosphodiesterase
MNKLSAIAICFLLFIGCNKFDKDELDNLTGEVWVIGHGGAGLNSFINPYPENSMGSHIRAIEYLDATGVETDVQLSSDNVLILYHNEELQSATQCEGCINTTDAATLKNCKYNLDFQNNITQEEYLITLDDLLDRYENTSIHPLIYLDLKTFNPCNANPPLNLDTMAAKVVEQIASHNAFGWVIVESFNPNVLLKIKTLDSRTRIMVDTRDVPGVIDLAVSNGYEGIVVGNEFVTKEDIALAHDSGLWITIFGVRSKSGHLNALEKNPDAIMTDNIEVLQEILN